MDKALNYESRGQGFDSQAGQVTIVVSFGFMCRKEGEFLKKKMQFDLLTNLKLFYIVDKRNSQFGIFDLPFLFSVQDCFPVEITHFCSCSVFGADLIALVLKLGYKELFISSVLYNLHKSDWVHCLEKRQLYQSKLAQSGQTPLIVTRTAIYPPRDFQIQCCNFNIFHHKQN